MKILIPHWIVKALYLLCLLFNTISICLCVSALVLLLYEVLNLSRWLGHSVPLSLGMNFSFTGSQELFNNTLIRELKHLLKNETTDDGTTTMTPMEPQEVPITDSIPIDMLVYLLLYLIIAILAVIGASTRYRRKKIYYLLAHVILLFSVICFNLLAWFHFRTYSPLNTSPYDELHLLLASLFDFVAFLIGLSLLASLIINRMFVGHKQRNSISPLDDSEA